MGISGVDYQDGPEDVHKSAKISGQEVVSWRERFQYGCTEEPQEYRRHRQPSIRSTYSPFQLHQQARQPQTQQVTNPDCCICLFAVSIRQALFIAPCSFHFKRITPLIEFHHLAFSCPLCRTYADLDEDNDVQPTDLDAYAEVTIDEGPSKFSNKGASIHSSIQYSWQRSVLSGLIPRTMQPTKRNPETCTLPKHPHQVYQKLVVRVPKPLGGAGPRSRRKPADMRISLL